ncbi:LysE family translocator [Rhizobium sp. SSA_523]|uniref:LysE family translocator n=1 Tax=Rhizobium sp. SSA_523 TaxID=2952477 RepID=UPI002091D95E|nr:LysE family translocator [Rhizobium sp. SSA_523]MCO5733057.1 LysE family translocator [Rhizobium sp. SSA_523]WKC23937.1 LysE family translocator [Rhizobium sp. SSA_523]
MSWEFLLTSLIVVATPGTGVIVTLAAALIPNTDDRNQLGEGDPAHAEDRALLASGGPQKSAPDKESRLWFSPRRKAESLRRYRFLSSIFGITHGRRAAVIAAFGCTLGIIPHMLAAITGLAAVLHASALAYEIIRYAGVAYLVHMAVMVLRDHGTLSIGTGQAQRSDRQLILSAILVNLLNPKLSIFFFAFLPQFIPAGTGDSLWQMIELSLVFMGMTFVIFVAYGFCAAAARDHILSRPSVMTGIRRGFAAAFIGLAIKLASTDR